MSLRKIVCLLLLIVAAGCRGTETAHEESSQPPPVMMVTAAVAKPGAIKTTLRVLGITVAVHHVTIRSPATGRLLGITLRNGDTVHKGQLIGHVVNREIEAAQAGLEVARKLDPQGAPALEQSVNRYNKGTGIPVVAPESGVVFRPPTTSGQMVADLDPIAELVDPDSIYVEASIPVDKLHLISPGMPAMVTSGLQPGVVLPARVAAIIPSFDASSATAPIRLDFAGKGTIREIGAPVEAEIITASASEAILIPVAALFQDSGDGRFHVFVVGPGGMARRVNVTTGMREGDEVQVLSGIKAGDEVITSGGYALSDGLKVHIAGPAS
jgi:multidrug efflux pump subunit AcrA (membrane-fusion protein)